MGIESDQLVYDYLSRVGDLAQQRHLPANDRMQLVSGLRNEIDRRRATHGGESPAAVRGILGDLGTPDEVVDRAGPPRGGVPQPRGKDGGGGRGSGTRSAADGPVPAGPAPGAPKTVIPAQDERGPDGRGTTGDGGPGVAAPGRDDRGSGPARPGSDRAADWWLADPDADADGVPGFVGGVERPELFAPPAAEEDRDGATEEPAAGRGRRLARVLRLRKAPQAPPPAAEPEEAPAAPRRARLTNPFVLLAALLLLAGAVFGSLIALAAGWLLAYASRRLTPAEAKGAVLVIPGLAAATGAAWLWGRVEGRWGAPVGPGGEAMGAAISETWPWVLRSAAIASALFLVWRSRRR
ncbi:hypothetical protein ACFW2Y_04585 [Streptomyces sp. NPDC058877]|uniref:hypothetical protein n=1 Tax=unclassified Streptomyces TaxID=2593676 RepID=UPI00368A4250